MHPLTKLSLSSVVHTCREIDLNIAGLDLKIYRNARTVQLSTERLLEIVGEALSRAEKRDPNIVATLPNARNIIGLRNRLARGSDAIDERIVWTAAVKHAPILRSQVEALLREQKKVPER